MPPKRRANDGILGRKGGGNWGPLTRHLRQKRAGGLLVGSSSRLGIQLAGWQWQRLLSIAAMAGT